MHILMDATGIEGRYGGVSRYAVNIARRVPQIAPSDDFTVVASESISPDHPLRRLDDLPNVETRTIKTPALGPRRQLALARFLRSWHEDPGFDLLHTLRTEAPLYQPEPTVVTIHDLKYLSNHRFIVGFPRIKTAYLRWAIGTGIRRANRTIAVSRHTRHDLLDIFDADPDKVVPTALASEMGEALAGTPESRDPNHLGGLGVAQPYFLWIGSFLPHKNLPTLLEALAAYKSDHDDRVGLVAVAQPGHKQDEYMDLARDLGVADDVTHVHSLDDEELVALYRQAEAFFFPSRYEGFGLPVLEAMECGTATVTSETTATAEVAGDAGLLVDPEDPAEIAEAMHRIRSSPDLQEKLVQAGRKRAAEFSWEETARRTYEIYQEVVDE